MNEILGFINDKTGKHYVFGDTHGAWSTVKKMIDELQINPRNDFIYFLGDYYYPLMHITDDDKKMFQFFNQYYVNRFDYPGIHLIRGNHEWK